jgi:arsenite oxidase small subunit
MTDTERQSLSRRGFMKRLLEIGVVGSIVAVIAPIIAYFYPSKLEEEPSEPVSAGDAASLGVGQSRSVRYGRYPALVIRLPDGLRVYSAVCTHFACIVAYNAEVNQIRCPCHDGFFDPADGSVISGPPLKPLRELPFYEEGGQIFIGEKQDQSALARWLKGL